MKQMKCTQETADEVLKRAKASSLGLGEPRRLVNMGNYEGDSPQILATALVGSFHDKYDIISIMQAAIELAYEKGLMASSRDSQKETEGEG